MFTLKKFFLLFVVVFISTEHSFAKESDVFSFQTVTELAKSLSETPYEEPPLTPKSLLDLDFPTYQKIHYQQPIWGKSQTPFSLEVFPPGYLFNYLIDVNIIENGISKPLAIDNNSFSTEDPVISETLTKLSKFAGIRLRYPINDNGRTEEFAVFQGASYFRGISKDQVYGISNRGLAIDVGQATGEEFPLFTRFWVERPSASHKAIVVYALLDSKSITGAYRFGIYPGSPTFMEVKSQLFPRKDLENVGIAALTSMFMHNAMLASQFPDYRPAVHDSDALAMIKQNGEQIWRPLTNPKRLQFSAFEDDNLQGFGLIQRQRRFTDYQDLDLYYESRPSAWIKPSNAWGKGQVVLVEIPSDSENNDNIVAYWHPEEILKKGQTYRYDYQISWPDDLSVKPLKAKIVRSALNARLVHGGKRDKELVIDYQGISHEQLSKITIDASISKGSILTKRINNNPKIKQGARLYVSFAPEDANMAEIRIQLKQDNKPISETWLYRWLK